MSYFTLSAKSIPSLKRTVVVSVILYSAYKLCKLLNISNVILNVESDIKSGLDDIRNQQIQQQWNTMNWMRNLPDDLIQNIISYIPYSPSIKLVNKCFNESSKRNIQIELIKANKLITKENHLISNLDERFNGKIWIIDPNRHKLTEHELKLGYRGPLNHILSAMIECSDGDRVFISGGFYEFDEFLLWTHTKSIMFIGIGKVTIKSLPNIFLRNTHFENIIFEPYFDDDAYDLYNINDIFAAELSLKKCIWNVTQSIHCSGNVYFEDCVFIHSKSCDYPDEGFIMITPWCSDAMIVGCTFSNFRCYEFLNRTNACIYIAQNSLRYVSELHSRPQKDRSATKLTIIGNTFERNKNYPIVFETSYSKQESYEMFINSDGLLIKHNILKGANILDANTNEYVNPNNIFREHDELHIRTTQCFSDSWMYKSLLQCLDYIALSTTYRVLSFYNICYFLVY